MPKRKLHLLKRGLTCRLLVATLPCQSGNTGLTAVLKRIRGVATLPCQSGNWDANVAEALQTLRLQLYHAKAETTLSEGAWSSI